MTPSAWYPLGDSELTSWPERALWRSASGGGVGRESGSAPLPRVAFDSEGRPVVAWVGRGVEVRRWRDSAWEVLPPSAPEQSESRRFDMVLDRAGNPVVVEQDQVRVHVMRWTDAGWVSLDEWPAEDFRAHRMSNQIALDEQDHPIVVYRDGTRVFVKRWEGTSFRTVRGGGTDGALTDDASDQTEPALALRQNGDIAVTWFEADRTAADDGAHGLWLLQFNGDGWEQLGDSADGAGVTYALVENLESSPTLAVDRDDRVIIAWDTWSESWVRSWDGVRWSPEQVGLAAPQLVRSPAGHVYLAGADSSDHLTLWRSETDEWTPIAVPYDESEWSYSEPALAIGPDEHAAVAWRDEDWGHIYLTVNTDGTWRELGEPTAEGEGLGSGEAQRMLAVDEGVFRYGSHPCRVDRWDGQTWEASDFHGWVDTLGECGVLTLAAAPTGQPVVAFWIDELHVLGWSEDGWEALTDPFPYSGNVGDILILTFDATGAPIVAWADDVPDHSEYLLSVIRWDGASWSTLRESEHVSSLDLNLRLLPLPDSRLILSWEDHESVQRGLVYDAGEWSELAGLERASDATLQLTYDASGTPFFSWPTAESLALYQLTGSNWKAVPADDSRLATLPEHVRTDVFSSDGEIYLRRFDDCAWRGLSASDRAGGISNSGATSRSPAFSLHDGTTCVAWIERAESESAQLVRCHD